LIDTPLKQRVVAEAVGTALLLAIVVGSGIMGERLSAGNTGIALLANSLATGAGLGVLILTFAPVSGAHFNPMVTLVQAFHSRLGKGDAAAYIAAQIGGAFVGVAVAHAMFGLPLLECAHRERSGPAFWFSECIATFGLLSVIAGCSGRGDAVALAVGAYVAAAYWFTSSTAFANPAVTLARAMTNTFTGIRPADAPGFMVAQVIGGALAALLMAWLVPAGERRSRQ